MNCVEWEERIALYAGGDLAAAEATAVELHVAGCSGCQLLLSGLRQSLDLVRQAHEEPIEAAHFAAVRTRVLAEIERAPARRWRMALWFAAAAAAVLLLVTLRPSTPARKPVEQAMAPAPVPPPAVVPAPAAVAPPVVRPQVRRRPAPQVARRLPQEPGHQMVVKLLTDDPDVVIYWITETKGE